MISLKEITTDEMFEECLEIEVSEEQTEAVIAN